MNENSNIQDESPHSEQDATPDVSIGGILRRLNQSGLSKEQRDAARELDRIRKTQAELETSFEEARIDFEAFETARDELKKEEDVISYILHGNISDMDRERYLTGGSFTVWLVGLWWTFKSLVGISMGKTAFYELQKNGGLFQGMGPWEAYITISFSAIFMTPLMLFMAVWYVLVLKETAKVEYVKYRDIDTSREILPTIFIALTALGFLIYMISKGAAALTYPQTYWIFWFGLFYFGWLLFEMVGLVTLSLRVKNSNS